MLNRLLGITIGCLLALGVNAQRENVALKCSKVSASYTSSWNNLNAINNGTKGFGSELPNNETWGCFQGETTNEALQTLTYTWDERQIVDSVSVYFWTDSETGAGVVVPESWHLEYQDDHGAMQKVTLSDGERYTNERYAPNHVKFTPVTTKTMTLVLNAKANGEGKYSAMGVNEWEVFTADKTNMGIAELLYLLESLHEKCVSDTLARNRQKWYNRDEMLAAFNAYTNAGNDSAMMQAAIDLLQAVHQHYLEITEVYTTVRTEVMALYSLTSKSKFALNDSVRQLRATAVTYYNKNEDHYEWMSQALLSVRELANLFDMYIEMGKAISVARNQYKATDYEGKDMFATALGEAWQKMTSAETREQFQQGIAFIQEAQAAYLKNRPSEWITIQNGQLWKTDKGATVQAHAPGFVRVGDIWYMCGEDRSNWWNPDVNLYSSTDLVNWKFEKKIIQNGVTTSELGSSRMIERPKLLYNAKTDKFLVWCHYESSNYGASEAACFECDSVNGAYKHVWSGRPLNVKSRDCNVFQDNDGTAYFISTTEENQHLGLFRLSDDCHEAVEHTQLFSWQSREAPAIVRIANRYFMFNSACSGWDPNQCKMSYTTNLKSGWTSLSNVGNNIAYDTQAAAILEIKGTKTTTYLYVGDRWQDPGLPETKTIIFPISFNGTSCTFKYHERFDINFVTGEWRETPTDKIFADKAGWKVIDKSSEEAGSGKADFAIDGNVNTMWHTRYSGSVAGAPHHITIDMGKTLAIKGFLATPRMDGNTNGLIRKYQFLVSQDGEKWTSVSSSDWLPYCTEVDFNKRECRYIKLICKEGTYASIAELDVVVDPSIDTAIEDAPFTPNSQEIIQRSFFSIDGRKITEPEKGIFIERTLFADGKVKSVKILR